MTARGTEGISFRALDVGTMDDLVVTASQSAMAGIEALMKPFEISTDVPA